MQDSQPINLEYLKDSIAISNSEMNQLAHNHQKFVGVIRKYNNEAKNKIMAQRPKEALVYLTQAEKVLEYAASCGKNIDRNIIVSILHNQACCYQKLWELEKCSNYIEALIFNISSHLKTSTPSPRQAEDYIKTSGSLTSHLRDSLYGKSINQRVQLSKYHLQFSAINSQLRNHKGALVSGRRAIAIIKDIFQELQTLSIQKSTIENSYPTDQMCPEQMEYDCQTKLHLIAGLASINDEPNISKLQDYITTGKFYFRKWNIRKHQQNNQSLKQSLKNFSIGTIMQIKPIGFEQSRQNTTVNSQNVILTIYDQKNHQQLLKTENLSKVINHVLLLTIGYFTIATQLRLIAAEKYRTCQQAQKNSSQYIQSQIYHIISLIVTSIYVPYDMIYMRHILTSFSNHYTGNLGSDQQLQNQEQRNIMFKQFDPCSFSEGRKKKDSQKKRVTIHKSLLAIDIADSIKVGQCNKLTYQNIVQKIRSNKASLKKNKKNSSKSKSKKKKTLKGKQTMMKSLKNSRQKRRGNSEQLIRNNQDHQNKLCKPRIHQISKKNSSQKKQSMKCLGQKMHKSASNNNSKKKKKRNSQEQPQKPKQEYYRSLKLIEKSKSPRGTAGKNNHYSSKQLQNSSKHITQHQTRTETWQRGIKIQKKKGTPLKKNLDRYYF